MTEMNLKNSTQDELNQQAKIIRREGEILERMDKEDDRGFRSVFFVEWQGFEWFIRMRNGEVTRIKRLWEIEEI